jgi:hypothetical protein
LVNSFSYVGAAQIAAPATWTGPENRRLPSAANMLSARIIDSHGGNPRGMAVRLVIGALSDRVAGLSEAVDGLLALKVPRIASGAA